MMATTVRLMTTTRVTLMPTTTLQEGGFIAKASHTHVHVVREGHGPICGGVGGREGVRGDE